MLEFGAWVLGCLSKPQKMIDGGLATIDENHDRSVTEQAILNGFRMESFD